MKETVSLDGIFIRTIYKASNYMVTRFEPLDKGAITVTGPSFDYEPYTKYTISGYFDEHPKYGYQFVLTTVSKYVPSKKDEIIKFLSSSNFKGIGKRAAEKIYNYYGDDTLKILKSDASELDRIGLTSTQLRGLEAGLESYGLEADDIVFGLISAGFSTMEANRIKNEYKEHTALVLKENPYQIYYDIYGISFSKIVNCFKNVEVEDKESKFKEAYLVYVFKEVSFRKGDIYLYKDEFLSTYARYYSDGDDVLDELLTKELLVKEEERYYLRSDYEDEKFIASYLNHFGEDMDVEPILLDESIEENENINGIKFDDYQKEAIKNFFNEKMSMIIGGPGTGKTTIIKCLVNIFKSHFPYQNIIVVAPTGRASKRINELSDVESKTIHSLLKWNKEDNSFTNNLDNPILYDCLIIDEFSMVDNSLFASLLKACSYVKKICIIGDNDQLPSIRQGDVLSDLIESNNFKISYLKCNHRQKSGSDIISLANDIVNECVDFSKYTNDVSFYDINKINQKEIIDLIKNDLDENNMLGLDNFQVLSTMYKGVNGIDNLNSVLQSAFNPNNISLREKKVNNIVFRENDKILELKNRPTDDVYNGDIGVLDEINEEEKYFYVKYGSVDVFYNFNDLGDITLAYAMSVHKAQGSEYPFVYFIFDQSQSHMLYKKLIYTAISRARNKLVLIGDKDLFLVSANKKLPKRKTSLIMRLKSML